MQSVGGRIRERRRELGYSQEKLAELLYMKKSTISAYETGTNDIPSRVLIELARELETSPGFLLTGDIEYDVSERQIVSLYTSIKSKRHKEMAVKQIKCILEAESSDRESHSCCFFYANSILRGQKVHDEGADVSDYSR